jgi:hypothetical protein
MFRPILIILGLSAALYGPDQRPDQIPADFWTANGEIYNLPLLDGNGNLAIQQTKFYVANSQIAADHARDRTGAALPHVHFRDDYQNAEDADRYWDVKLDSPRMTKRITSATVKTNCSAYILGKMGNGNFSYWIDDNFGAVQKAFNAELGAVAAGKQTPANRHAPPVSPARLQQLTWKNGASGTYEAKAQAYDASKLQLQPTKK